MDIDYLVSSCLLTALRIEPRLCHFEIQGITFRTSFQEMLLAL